MSKIGMHGKLYVISVVLYYVKQTGKVLLIGWICAVRT